MFQAIASQFEALHQDLNVIVAIQPFNAYYTQSILATLMLAEDTFDVFWSISPSLREYISTGVPIGHHVQRLVTLNDRVETSTALDWDDIHPYYREQIATVDGDVLGVPFDDDHHLLFVRDDVISTFVPDAIALPETLEELVDTAMRLQDTAMADTPGAPTHAACLVTTMPGASAWFLHDFVAPFIQTKGSAQGSFFADDMTPLVRNRGYRRGLELYMLLHTVSLHDSAGLLSWTEGQEAYLNGTCAMLIGWAGTAFALAHGTTPAAVRNGTKYGLVPGTTTVWDRDVDKNGLVACDEEICPFAEPGTGPNAGKLVNYAPTMANGAKLLMIPSTSPVKDVAWAFIEYALSPAVQNVYAFTQDSTEPSRTSQMTNSTLWTDPALGNMTDAEYAHVLAIADRRLTLRSNLALDPRILGSSEYLAALHTEMQALMTGKCTMDDAMNHIHSEFERITDKHGRRDQIVYHRMSLGLYPYVISRPSWITLGIAVTSLLVAIVVILIVTFVTCYYGFFARNTNFTLGAPLYLTIGNVSILLVLLAFVLNVISFAVPHTIICVSVTVLFVGGAWLLSGSLFIRGFRAYNVHREVGRRKMRLSLPSRRCLALLFVPWCIAPIITIAILLFFDPYRAKTVHTDEYTVCRHCSLDHLGPSFCFSTMSLIVSATPNSILLWHARKLAMYERRLVVLGQQLCVGPMTLLVVICLLMNHQEAATLLIPTSIPLALTAIVYCIVTYLPRTVRAIRHEPPPRRDFRLFNGNMDETLVRITLPYLTQDGYAKCPCCARSFPAVGNRIASSQQSSTESARCDNPAEGLVRRTPRRDDGDDAPDVL